ncbi:MAG: indolepyruvate oxidoreductase subunit beta [Solirubrobacterales bacterium]
MIELAKDPLNIIFCGVGGQGNILASELLASALVASGFYATVGETYGASQRGGAVMSHIRISRRRLYGPLIPRGEADILVGFEPIETLRIARDYGNRRTRVLLNPRPNYPLAVLSGETAYPSIEAIGGELKAICGAFSKIDATEAAKAAGNAQTTNVVLVGALCALDEMEPFAGSVEAVIRQRFAGKSLDLNLNAFQAGFKAMKACG